MRPDGFTIITHAVAGVAVGMFATFGAPQRAVGERSPNGRMSQATLVRRDRAE